MMRTTLDIDAPVMRALKNLQKSEGNVAALLNLPQVRMIAEQDGFWELYRSSIDGLAVRNKLVPAAHLGTLLRQHGVKTIYTNDADFRKFEFLDVKNQFS